MDSKNDNNKKKKSLRKTKAELQQEVEHMQSELEEKIRKVSELQSRLDKTVSQVSAMEKDLKKSEDNLKKQNNKSKRELRELEEEKQELQKKVNELQDKSLMWGPDLSSNSRKDDDGASAAFDREIIQEVTVMQKPDVDQKLEEGEAPIDIGQQSVTDTETGKTGEMVKKASTVPEKREQEDPELPQKGEIADLRVLAAVKKGSNYLVRNSPLKAFFRIQVEVADIESEGSLSYCVDLFARKLGTRKTQKVGQVEGRVSAPPEMPLKIETNLSPLPEGCYTLEAKLKLHAFNGKQTLAGMFEKRSFFKVF